MDEQPDRPESGSRWGGDGQESGGGGEGVTWKWCGVTLVGREEGPRALVATLSNMRVMKPLSVGSSSVSAVAPSADSSSPLMHIQAHSQKEHRSMYTCSRTILHHPCVVWQMSNLSTHAGGGGGGGVKGV